jgi:hypothetical protein
LRLKAIYEKPILNRSTVYNIHGFSRSATK